MQLSLSIIALLALPLASAHCKITAAKGDLGGSGVALGITTGSGNSQSDVTVFKSNGNLGATAGGGAIDVATGIPAAEKVTGSTTLPQVSSGGTLTMTLHQINGDGAGPMTCQVDTTGTGSSFEAMDITTNVPGTNGNSNAANQDFPLVAVMPAGTICAGTVAGQSGICLIKCANPAAAGPFGGTVVVQQAGSAGAAAGNVTAGVSSIAAVANSTVVATGISTGTAAAVVASGRKAKAKGKHHKQGNKVSEILAKRHEAPIERVVSRKRDIPNKRDVAGRRSLYARAMDELQQWENKYD